MVPSLNDTQIHRWFVCHVVPVLPTKSPLFSFMATWNLMLLTAWAKRSDFLRQDLSKLLYQATKHWYQDIKMDLQLTAPATTDTLNKLKTGNFCSLGSLSHYSSLNVTKWPLWSPSASFHTTESCQLHSSTLLFETSLNTVFSKQCHFSNIYSLL